MLELKNAIARGLRLFQPIDGRPDLMIARLKDGREATFYDGLPLNPKEYCQRNLLSEHKYQNYHFYNLPKQLYIHFLHPE